MRKKNKFYRRFVKRFFDFILTIPAVIILSPLMAVIALLVRINMGLPIIYKQKRPGIHGNLFSFFKFRSMTNDRDHRGYPWPDEKRLTNFGKFLRRTSLDELPELWNVLRGDMSLVGPRPLLVEYLNRYSPEQARRHEVKPGITGWAQINGRNAITWEEKFKYDVWYVDHWNLWLDIKIVFLTIFKVLTGEGINQPGKITMEEFKGKNKERGCNEKQI